MRKCVLLLLIVAQPSYSSNFKLGLENLSIDFLRSLSDDGSLNYQVGLITNQTGQDQKGNRNIDLLLAKGVKLSTIFVPEHGYDTTVPAGSPVKDSIDKKTGLPIISLYGGGSQHYVIEEDAIKNIQLFIFDMADSGMRHFIYISTLYKALEVAAQFNKKIVVLDRPNPLTGVMEGPFVEPEFRSFISLAPIPLRHGMTMGELAQYFNIYELKQPAKLYVVPMQGYDRNKNVIKKLMAPLSPNVANIDSCLGYSFLGLLGDVRPFDVCIDTELAFQCIALPDTITLTKTKWQELRDVLSAHHVKSEFFNYFSRRKKQSFTGLKIAINDINKVSSMNTLLAVLNFFKQADISLLFSAGFDKALGSSAIRLLFQNNVINDGFTQKINERLYDFLDRVQSVLIYKPIPKIEELRKYA